MFLKDTTQMSHFYIVILLVQPSLANILNWDFTGVIFITHIYIVTYWSLIKKELLPPCNKDVLTGIVIMFVSSSDFNMIS